MKTRWIIPVGNDRRIEISIQEKGESLKISTASSINYAEAYEFADALKHAMINMQATMEELREAEYDSSAENVLANAGRISELLSAPVNPPVPPEEKTAFPAMEDLPDFPRTVRRMGR